MARASLAGMIVLAGCATGQPLPAAPTVPVSGLETVLVTQPAVVPAYSNANPPKGTVGVTLWGPVEKLPSLPTDATSSNGVLDIVIDSASIPGNVAARNGLGTIVLGYTFKTPVQGAQYRASYDLRVTRAERGPASVAQVVTYFNLHDRVNGTSVWLGQIAFDTRCGKSGAVLWDQGSNTPIFNVVAANFSCSTFGDWRSVSFAVGPAEISAAATALRARFPTLKLSSNAADYGLSHANINPELAVAAGERARIDVGIRNWKITQQE